MTVLDEALRWNDNGVSTIPFYLGTKRPIYNWSKWKQNLPDHSLLKAWFSKENNVALICGNENNAKDVSLVVIDFDLLPEYYQWRYEAIEKGGIWEWIALSGYRVKSGKGMHLYMYVREKTPTFPIRNRYIDVRGDGSCILAPPSLHPSGKRYEYQSGTILTIDSIEEMFEVPKYEYISERKTSILDQCYDYGDEIPYDKIEAIHEKVPIIEVASMYTKLKQSCGKLYWTGRCPVHDDTNPSFSVNVKTNRCYCFATRCRLNGHTHDVIDLVSLCEQIPFKSAVMYLIEKYNI